MFRSIQLKRTRFFLIAVLFLFCQRAFGQATTTEDPKWTKEQLQNIYSQFLRERGYIPSIDDDGDVRFIREEKTYYIPIREADPEYFSIVLANIWPIESTEEKQKALEACNEITATTKVSKISIVSDSNIIIKGEVYISHPSEATKVFRRILSSMDTIRREFLQTMRK
jgi:hypothetical protein